MSGALASREQCPAIPYTPAEYAAEARRVVDEGGVMVHLHARTPDGAPSHEIADFRAITEAIRAEVGDAVIVNYSTGALGVPIEKRLAYLRELRPEVGALNMGSMNYAKYSARRQGLRLQGGVRELVRHDPGAAGRDGRVRDPARARVLRLGARRVAGSAAGHGRAEAAAVRSRS